jgi:nucleoside-diphosphate kinase
VVFFVLLLIYCVFLLWYGEYQKENNMNKKQLTFTYIKPDAIKHLDEILTIIRENGYEIIFISENPVQLTQEQAEAFYAQHKGRPYFENLVKHTISGYIVAAILEKDNAIEDFRKLIGATNPANAEKGTIRNLYGNTERYANGEPTNAIHGSDSPERVKIEAGLLLPDFIFEY